MTARAWRATALTIFLTLALTLSAGLLAADIYDQAVAHAGRPADDLQRDGIDHPAEVLRLAGIRPGMKVGDFLAAEGYFSELLSYIVGPEGHVYLLNNAAYDRWSEGHWKGRIEGRLPNVEHRTIDAEHMDLPDRSLDALIMVKVYHDLYWVDEDPKDLWPRYDVDQVLKEAARVLRPGGTLLLIDHSAKAGTGSQDAGSLHRIDEAYARADFEKHGFKWVKSSDVLRRPDDPREQITYKGPMVGKTDRFVMVLRRTG
ncbi:MAG: class I SAM-dependent methyltransferase [Gammaproteobacteria bacterium]|nr:class I SAM-dependent methyltransferase [Gammaproteobacteria bacterium]